MHRPRNPAIPPSEIILGLNDIGKLFGRSRWAVARWIRREGFPAARARGEPSPAFHHSLPSLRRCNVRHVANGDSWDMRVPGDLNGDRPCLKRATVPFPAGNLERKFGDPS